MKTVSKTRNFEPQDLHVPYLMEPKYFIHSNELPEKLAKSCDMEHYFLMVGTGHRKNFCCLGA